MREIVKSRLEALLRVRSLARCREEFVDRRSLAYLPDILRELVAPRWRFGERPFIRLQARSKVAVQATHRE